MEGPESLRGNAGTSATSRSPRSTRSTCARCRRATRSTSTTCCSRPSSCSRPREQVRERYGRKFRYVMVDEYQDTNRPQYLLIRGWPRCTATSRVVGDPDQSIYKWRGADLRNILDFEHDFPRRQDRPARAELPLDAGHPRRRDRRHQQNRNRKDKRLWTDRKGGDKIVYYRGATSSRRPTTSRASIKRALADDVDTMMAVLYRTNAQSRAIEDALMREAIPYKIIGGVRFYERKEIKDALAYLQADHQSARRREPPAGHQRAGARHRQGRDGLAAGNRSRTRSPPTRRRSGGRPRRVSSARSLWAVWSTPSKTASWQPRRALAARRSATSSSGSRTTPGRTRSRSRWARCSIRSGYLQGRCATRTPKRRTDGPRT